MEPKSLKMGPDYTEGTSSNMKTMFRRSPHPGHTAQTSRKSGPLGRVRRAFSRGDTFEPSGLDFPIGRGATDLTANRRPLFLIAVALMGALAVILTLLLLNNFAFAQDAEMRVDYAERGIDPVLEFGAADPEGVDTIVWSLVQPGADFTAIDVNNNGETTDAVDVVADDVRDAGAFRITASGELSFRSPPNYEMPTDAESGGTDPNNTYHVVVQASDGGVSDNAAEAMEYLSWYKVIVTVKDVEEKGQIKLMLDGGTAGTTDEDVPLVQPQVGILIRADLSDPDGPTNIPDATWRWFRTSDLAQEGTPILNDAGDALLSSGSHTPRDTAGVNDVDMYLRVKATYEDRRGKRKTAEAVSRYPVLAAIVNLNTDPEFAAATAERRISEDAASGATVGRPVTAIDPDAEKLSYDLIADSTETADVDSFNIDPETGQITLDGSLDFETKTQYAFQVRATDSRGGATGEGDNPNVAVTVLVTDLDEMPDIERPTEADVLNPMLIVHAGGNAIEHLETDEVSIATYTITDDDEGTPVLSVAGADEAMFTFKYNADTEDVDNDVILAFKSKPDFEMPADQGMDNIYEVTLQADDGNNVGTLDVTVKVTNAEENGEVTLSHQQPLIGQEVTASIVDSDGGFDANRELTRLAWMWERTTNEGGCPDDLADAEWESVDNTSESYTPTAADDGDCLRATATYLDRTYNYPHAPRVTRTEEGMAFEAAASVVSGVVRDDPANSKPEFPTPIVRFLPENTGSHKFVDVPVTADDADPADVLTYSLEGTDSAAFYIAAGLMADDSNTAEVDEEAMAGQIRVDDSPLITLDHEKKPRYDVRVEVTDSTSLEADAFDMADVDIYVTDVDEKPDIWVNEDGTQVRASEGEFNVNYNEDDDALVVLTLMARDPEKVRSGIVWSLLTADTGVQDLGEGEAGDDVAAADVADFESFEISSNGVLSFKNQPSFEGASVTGDDVYRVVLQASDGGTTGDERTAPDPADGYLHWFKVTVTVRDVEEEGEIEVSPTGVTDAELLQPQVDVGITASVSDPDGPDTVTSITWKWERQSRGGQWETITGATTEAYTPEDTADPNNPNPPAGETNRIDVGDRLRVTATYTDAGGSGKSAQKVLDNPVLGDLVTNTVPAFSSTTATRQIDEDAPRGTPVGAPLVAVDPDTESQGGPNRKVSYWLSTGGTDNSLFRINAETGQISVWVPQDYESPLGGTGDNSTEYTVVAMATDSSAESTADPGITVTINLIDLDDAPEIDLVIEGENSDLDDSPPTVIEHDGGNALEYQENGEARVVSFTVSDQDGGTPALSLSGNDNGMFKIVDRMNADGTALIGYDLAFNDSPDFESPADMHRDNVYEVTIEADDGRNTSTANVSVKVTNMEEDGEAALAYQQPLIGRGLTASVTDSDGGFSPTNGRPRDEVTRVRWTWYNTEADGFQTNTECLTDTNIWVVIPNANSATYTPAADDDTRCLRANVTYLDRTYAYPQPPSDTPEAGVGFEDTAQVISGVVRIDPANTAPTVDDAMRWQVENTPGHKYVGNPVTGMDGDPLVYSLGGDDERSFYIAGTMTADDGATDRNEEAAAGQIWVAPRTMLDYEGKPTYSVEVTATDTYDASDSGDVTINVVDVDEAPVILAFGTRVIVGLRTASCDENAPCEVGTYRVPGETPTWTLSGADGRAFDISTSGVVTSVSNPDYERENSYAFTVNAIVGTGQTAEDVTHEVTVNVTNEEEPGSVSLSTDTPRVGGEIMAIMFDDDDIVVDTTVMWQWESSADGSDPWTPIAGATADTYMVAEADGGMFVRVRVSYTDGYGNDEAVSDRTDNAVNVAPAFATETDARSVAENTAAGEDIGALVEATDADADDTLTYTLGGADAASFAIDSSTGQLMTRAALDFEAEASYTVEVTATDNAGDNDTITVTISVNNVEEPGSVTLEFVDPLRVGAVVTATLSDPDVAVEESVEWQWASSTDGVGAWADITGATEATYIVAETDGGKYLRAMASYTDGFGSDEAVSAATASAVNVAPAFATETDARSVAENTAAGEDIGALVEATDADADDTLTYTLGGADAASFAIDSSTGQLKTRAALDFETEASYTVEVTATDNAGDNDTITVTISVNNVEEPGSVTLEFVDPLRVGAAVTATLEDPDTFTASDVTWQWQSDDGPDSWANITGATEATYMVAETDGGKYLRAMASYTDGFGSDEAVSAATDSAVNIAPAFATETDARSVAENTAAGEDIGALVEATDADADDTLTYTLGGADAASFAIDSSTGQLMTRAALDFEAEASYTVEVTATDNAGDNDTITVTISVNNVEEPGSVTLEFVDPLRVGAVVTATLSDPDVAVEESVEWQWASSTDGVGAWADITGATEATYMVAETDGGKYLRAMASYTDSEGSGKSASAATASAVNVAPAFATETDARSVAENTAAGEDIGALVEATDADADDTLTYTLGGADAASFAIDSSTGQLKTRAALDFEAEASYTVEVTATDNAGDNDTITVTISVTDVNTGSALGDTYDTNDDGRIEKEEARAAVTAYFAGTITKEQARTIITLYFAHAS